MGNSLTLKEVNVFYDKALHVNEVLRPNFTAISVTIVTLNIEVYEINI
ncbi:hypothetical protein [Solibacillus cecembensis]